MLVEIMDNSVHHFPVLVNSLFIAVVQSVCANG